ncbi:hypothetical protein L1887_60927 [Cichorium endivia]|nr:hypothetical protein L1887_60927 [Cichorium endivia]
MVTRKEKEEEARQVAGARRCGCASRELVLLRVCAGRRAGGRSRARFNCKAGRRQKALGARARATVYRTAAGNATQPSVPAKAKNGALGERGGTVAASCKMQPSAADSDTPT